MREECAVDSKVDMKEIIAENLNRLMQNAGKERKEICKELDIKYTTFCDWANGKTYPRMENLVNLSKYFDVKITDFFLEKDEIDTYGREERIMSYVAKTGTNEIDLWLIPNATDELVRSMINAGMRFKHHSFEDIVERNGSEELMGSGEYDWGEPAGRELW